MTTVFNPLASNFSTVGFVADADDYTLEITDIKANRIGTEDPKRLVLEFRVRIRGGRFDGKFPPSYQVWDPQLDFSGAGKIILAAMGYIPGKQDQEFVESHADLDISLGYDEESDTWSLGSGYETLKGAVFTATLTTRQDKSGVPRQNYKLLRPVE